MKGRAKLNKLLHSQAGIFNAALTLVKSSYHHGNGMGFFLLARFERPCLLSNYEGTNGSMDERYFNKVLAK